MSGLFIHPPPKLNENLTQTPKANMAKDKCWQDEFKRVFLDPSQTARGQIHRCHTHGVALPFLTLTPPTRITEPLMIKRVGIATEEDRFALNFGTSLGDDIQH